MSERYQVDVMSVYLEPSDLAPNSLGETIESLMALKPRDWTREMGDEDCPIAIYGAGDFGDFALRYLNNYDVSVNYVIDADLNRAKELAGTHGLEVLEIDAVERKQRLKIQVLVTIATTPFSQIYSSLKSRGYSHVTPFYQFLNTRVPAGVLKNGWTIDSGSPEILQDVNDTVRSLVDSTSIAHYLRFVTWHTAGVDLFFEDGIEKMERYFIPAVMERLNKNQRIVDVGCHHGNFVKRYLELVGGFKSALLIDGDRASSDLCLQRYANDDRVNILNQVVWSVSGPVSFLDGLHYSSQVFTQGTGDELKQVACTLDDLGIECDLLKIHVEGGERDVLEGAQKTIDVNRPIILATIYHNDDGIARTQRFLTENFEGYSVLQRSHAWCGTGQVLYGIPRERCCSVGNSHP